jgi:GTP-binding protein
MPSRTRAQAALPVVAIVGRPNVGKSTIFNRFVGQRQAIVEDRARTTRDRMYGDAEWNGRRFVIVDTGGLEIDTDDPIELKVQEQARLAIGEADVILFVVDAVSGMTPADQEAAELLRKASAPVLVAANKVDNTAREADAAEFWSLGWSETYPISASHGRGTGDLLDAIVWSLPPNRKPRSPARRARTRPRRGRRRSPPDVSNPSSSPLRSRTRTTAPAEDDEVAARWDAAIAVEANDDEPAAITFVGRPNVGKSSLLNALLGEDRAIVSDIPGTTRDAIDTTLEWGRSEVVLIDTAGIKRRGKVASGPAAERYSTLRALKASRGPTSPFS